MSNLEPTKKSNAKHQPSAPEIRVAGVRFQSSGKVYGFDASGFDDLEPGDFVLVETARGQQLGQVISIQPLREGERREDLKPVQRRAFGCDLAVRQKWQAREKESLELARQEVARMGLPIKVVIAEYTFDGQRLTLLYVSDEKKFDPAELLRRLQHKLDVRVDLRRIGPRDQAKLMGGYGACGEPRCCARFLSDFNPVSIKMAKTQGVSLNPSDITGMCGRLRCCLVYEQELYADACHIMPRRKKRVRTPYGEGKVVDLLPLKGIVVVQVEDRRVEVPVEDIELIKT